jgi:hypothetical protein
MDRRFPPLEDALVLRDLLISYELAAAEGEFLLLKAKSFDSPKLNLLREGTVRLGQPIDLRDYGRVNLWMEIDLEPTLIGRLRQFLYRPPTVWLAARRDLTGETLLRKRAPASMLAAGFLVSPLLSRNEDVLALYTGNTITRPGTCSVELIPGDEHFWLKMLHFRIYKIENSIGRGVPADGVSRSDAPRAQR